MKLPFDQNLSPRLVRQLADLYPDALHISGADLERAPDVAVWEYARQHGMIIVTKDANFSDMSVLGGYPPKVVWLRLGNCTTRDIEQALRRSHHALLDFDTDPNVGVLEVS